MKFSPARSSDPRLGAVGVLPEQQEKYMIALVLLE